MFGYLWKVVEFVGFVENYRKINEWWNGGMEDE